MSTNVINAIKKFVLHVFKRLLVLALALVFLLFLLNQYLRASIVRSLSDSHFEYVHCSRHHGGAICVDFKKLPCEMKNKLLQLLARAARSSFLDINSYVLGVSVVKRGLSVNVHPNFIVFNVDCQNFAWQLVSSNRNEGRDFAIEFWQWMMAHSKGDLAEPPECLFDENGILNL